MKTKTEPRRTPPDQTPPVATETPGRWVRMEFVLEGKTPLLMQNPSGAYHGGCCRGVPRQHGKKDDR